MAVETTTPVPPPEVLRANALAGLLTLATDSAVDPATRAEAVAALRAARDQLYLLTETASDLGPDELRVLLVLAKRLRQGQSTYGLLRLATDGRDWLQERSAELQDALIYTAIMEVAATTKGTP